MHHTFPQMGYKVSQKQCQENTVKNRLKQAIKENSIGVSPLLLRKIRLRWWFLDLLEWLSAMEAQMVHHLSQRLGGTIPFYRPCIYFVGVSFKGHKR